MAALTTTLLAASALAVGTYSFVKQQEAQEDAQTAQRKSANEQKAINASQAANERRQQIREERVRRARIEQSSMNTGAYGSSGALGTIGGLSTQFSTNVGANLAMQAASQQISIFNQQASDAQYSAQTYAGMFNLAGNIFGATAGSAASYLKGKFMTPAPSVKV